MKKPTEPIESSKFVSNKGRVSGDFDSRKDSHPKKFEPRPRILSKLRFGEEVWHQMILDDAGMDVVVGVRGLFVGVVFGL